MRKIFLIIAFTVFQVVNISAQPGKDRLNQLFDKYQETEGVTSIKIAKPMFGMLSKLDIKDSELEQIKPLLSKIQGLKIMIIDENPQDSGSDKPASFYKNLSKEILSSVNSLNYEELMTVNSKDSKIKFLSSDATDGVLDNLLLNIKSEDNTVLMMLDGKISMDDVNNLINETKISFNNNNNTTTTTTTTTSFSDNGTKTTTSSASSEERKVESFTGIDAGVGVKVNFTQSGNQKVVVETDAGMLPYIITKVEGDILKISIDSKGKKNMRINKILVSVNAPTLQKIKTTSGASFSTLNRVKGNSFDVSATSGSSLNAELQAKTTINLETTSGADLKVNADAMNLIFNGNSGSSSVVTGTAEKANFVLSSAASCNAQNFVVKDIQASATSASSLKVNATQKLNSVTSSGGSVRFSGKPSSLTSNNSSGGSTKSIN